MSPYDLEASERKYREQLVSVMNRGGPMSTLLAIIFDMQSVIVRHLADVEAEATLKRHHEAEAS